MIMATINAGNADRVVFGLSVTDDSRISCAEGLGGVSAP